MNASTWGAGVPPFSLDEIATAVLDPDGTVLWWSQAAANLLHRPSAEVCGYSVSRLLVNALGCRIDGGAIPAAGQATLRQRSGATIEVDFRVLPLEGRAELLTLAAPSACVTAWEQDSALVRALFAQDRIKIRVHDTALHVVRTNITSTTRDASFLPPSDRSAKAMTAGDTEAALRRVLETGTPLTGHDQSAPSTGSDGRRSTPMAAARMEDALGKPLGVVTLLTGEELPSGPDPVLRQQVSVRIGASLDVTRTAQDLADVLVPALGDLASVTLAEAVLQGDEPPQVLGGGELHRRRVAAASAAGPWPPALLQPGEAIPPMPDTPTQRSLQHGGAFILDHAAAVATYGDPELVRMFIPEHGHSGMWAPLFARGLVLGVVSVWRTDRPEPFDEADAELLTEIASRAALSVDNARRYARERRANIILQQRLLPRALIDSPAVRTASVYLPASDGAGIGGDWFDVVALPSLRTALVVGDVVGHGLSASATMGRLRTAVQTLADLELDPTELLTHLDDLVARLAAETDPAQRDAMGATCLYAVYDPVIRCCSLASAGHPPPVLFRPDGTARALEVPPGPPLGVGGLPFETTTIDLEPGSVLALYTDGLITGDDLDPETGLRRLTADLAAQCRPDRPLDETARALVADATDGPRRDDIALLLTRTRALPADTTADWQFPADSAIVADARDVTARRLADWECDELAFTTELIVSELVTNAIRYAGEPIGLRLIRTATGLICEVTDPSNTQPRLRRARTTDEGGRGLFLVAQLTERWGCRYGPSGKTIWAEQLVDKHRGVS
ncbi:SpoIIE family protein phosphatase [Streptomyces violaceusniger]|uniref:SpoIIE family protein phosphatase n=1 Tax=Streptomyces violaceusniger TaxID=68280 RepID=UPI000998D7FE|nr:SpoIIE family protein phosphatase [Streptomyces hygroscopicus]AQW46602.1 protein phosphatase [Streptomyces hygroscopicus]